MNFLSKNYLKNSKTKLGLLKKARELSIMSGVKIEVTFGDENKSKEIFVKKTNINKIRTLLGPPSTKSYFDNDVLIYIKSSKKNILSRLKKRKLYNNKTLNILKESKDANLICSEKDNGIYYEKIGHTQKKYFEIDGELKVDINDLFKINNNWYNSY